ncbi:MAG: hypothetical protein ACTH2J_08475 [Candidatus Microbacterium stercoravium]|uniref:Uncharacterized protein n=1 Tax=Candidatus Microbacterium stercoravium TaxID=2838697 RepID=A0A9D2H3S1_9MICO|nr:hypothetical protein [Candidatus Microbacterium stercoravium]
MVAPTNIRFSSGVEERLASFVKLNAQSKNSVVNTAVSEWLRMQAHPRVRFIGIETGERRAALVDGPQVWTIAESWLAHEPEHRDVGEVAEVLDLPRRAVEAALDYWAENREEIDGILERHRAAQDDALAAWEARQRLQVA